MSEMVPVHGMYMRGSRRIILAFGDILIVVGGWLGIGIGGLIVHGKVTAAAAGGVFNGLVSSFFRSII